MRVRQYKRQELRSQLRPRLALGNKELSRESPVRDRGFLQEDLHQAVLRLTLLKSVALHHVQKRAATIRISKHWQDLVIQFE